MLGQMLGWAFGLRASSTRDVLVCLSPTPQAKDATHWRSKVGSERGRKGKRRRSEEKEFEQICT